MSTALRLLRAEAEYRSALIASDGSLESVERLREAVRELDIARLILRTEEDTKEEANGH